MELVNGHESFLALSNRGALSILDASFKFARASCLVSGEPWSTVRLDQRAFEGLLCLSPRFLVGLMSAFCVFKDASEKGFAFAVREGCRECFGGEACLGTVKVPEQLQVHRCLVMCASIDRGGCCVK